MKNLGLNYNFRLEGFYLSSNLFNSFSRFKVENDDFRTYWGIFCFFACFEMSYHESGFPSFPSKMFGIFKNMSLFCALIFYCSKTGFHYSSLLCKGESPL